MKKRFIVTVSITFITLILLVTACSPQPKAELENPPASPPLNFNLQLQENSLSSFRLSNSGNAELTYTITENAESLKLNQTTGNLSPGAEVRVAVTASCKQVGTFAETIAVTSNGGDTSIPVNLTCVRAENSGYSIEVSFIGNSTTDEQKAAFAQAELRWEGIVTSELEDQELAAPSDYDSRITSFCDPTEADLTGTTIDDLLIYAKVGNIDGPGNILAQAGPVLARQSTVTPFLGCMIFDSSDIDTLVKGGSFADVVTHEMGHVLGIGTLWSLTNRNFLDKPCPNTSKVGFIGNKTKIEFGVLRDNTDGSTPPVEEDSRFGPGTFCGHWDEAFFGNELMTGFAEEPGVTMPLSNLTIASLKDIGYNVDYSQADSYSLPTCTPACTPLLTPQAQEKPWELLLEPIALVGPDGKISQIR